MPPCRPASTPTVASTTAAWTSTVCVSPALADRYRLVAPDCPGFGHSDFPPVDRFDDTFDGYAALMKKFTRAVALRRYALYLQDYGGPVGMRLALAAPERVDALIIQNSNAYLDGLGETLAPLQAYWRDDSPENRQVIRNWFSLEGMRLNYTTGMPAQQIELLSPDTWHLDWAGMSRPGNIECSWTCFTTTARICASTRSSRPISASISRAR